MSFDKGKVIESFRCFILESLVNKKEDKISL